MPARAFWSMTVVLLGFAFCITAMIGYRGLDWLSRVAVPVMRLLNIWSTQDNTIDNFGVAGCNLLRTQRRRLVTAFGAAIGTALAVAGMHDYLVRS